MSNIEKFQKIWANHLHKNNSILYFMLLEICMNKAVLESLITLGPLDFDSIKGKI